MAFFISAMRAIIFAYELYFVAYKATKDPEITNMAQSSDVIYIIDCLAQYGAIILGVQWLMSMQELSAMIRLSDLIQKYDGTNIDYIE